MPWSRTSGFGRHPFCLSSRADTLIRATHQNQGLFSALGPHPLILPPPARACRRRACTREPPPPVASVWRLGRGRAAMRDALPHAGRERACAPAAMHRPAALRPSAATGRPATSPAARSARPAARPLGGWVGGAGWIAAGPGTGSQQGRPNLEPRAELPVRQHHGDPSHCWARILTAHQAPFAARQHPSRARLRLGIPAAAAASRPSPRYRLFLPRPGPAPTAPAPPPARPPATPE